MNTELPKKTDAFGIDALNISVPHDARLKLFSGMPQNYKYYDIIKAGEGIKPTRVTFSDGDAVYSYDNLEEGLYHYTVYKEGYTAVCQIVNFASSGKKIKVELYPILAGGYESGYTLLNSSEFIDRQLLSDKNTWGEEFSHLFNTPRLARLGDCKTIHKQTTSEEMWDFINGLSEKNENMHVFVLGKSPKYEIDMPLVLFTRENVGGKSIEEAAEIIRNNGKPTVQYTAQVHSNEPASCEGALAMMLHLTSERGRELLDAVDVYIVPRINLDGAVEVIRESPTTGDDMNRDYLYMNNKEIRMVTSAYNLFLPEVAIDGHEKRSDFLKSGDFRATDMELQVGAGSLNHPPQMTALAMKIAFEAIYKGREFGLRTHFYDNLASAAGGSAGSSYYGTRNSLSFLVETPGGTTLGGFCMERRIMAQFVLASTAIGYAAKNAEEVMSTVNSSRKKLMEMGKVYDENNLITLEHGKEISGELETPLIDIPSGKVTDEAHKIPYHEHFAALNTRPRPTAYVIPKGIDREKKILGVITRHAVPYYTFSAGSSVMLRQYIKREEEILLSDEKAVKFEMGAYVFPNTVPSTVLSVIMEPDFNSVSKRKMTLLSMGLVSPDEEGFLPIYRYCHDLTDGKVEKLS